MDIDVFHEDENPDDLPQVLLLARKKLLWQNKPVETENDFYRFLLKDTAGDVTIK
ncbi:MAG: hypothetical protein H7334_12395 [Ferruginibacter sp.]|nr:hypothetical protein [Ferruginibacter sp.]